MNRLAVLLLIVLSSIQSGCHDDNTYICEGKLKDKSLDHIRHCIEGRWRLHYAIGGFTGKLVHQFSDTHIQFKENNSISCIDDGHNLSQSVIEWNYIVDQFNEKTYIMSFEVNGLPSPLGVFEIKNDSLILYDIGADCWGYVLTQE